MNIETKIKLRNKRNELEESLAKIYVNEIGEQEMTQMTIDLINEKINHIDIITGLTDHESLKEFYKEKIERGI